MVAECTMPLLSLLISSYVLVTRIRYLQVLSFKVFIRWLVAVLYAIV